MIDVQDEMTLAQQEIERAHTELLKASNDRKAAKGSDSLTVAKFEAAVNAAKKSLSAAEVRLRRIYESKDDGG